MSEQLPYLPDDERHDLIAYESFLIRILTDLDPNGLWQSHELYQARRKRRYGGLTVGQFHQHLDLLEAAIDQLTPEHYRQWLATRHQEPQDDAQTESIESAKTPMA